MASLSYKPYKVLWTFIPVLLALSLLNPSSLMDIQMHDTYFVIATIYIVVLASLFLLVTGFAYWLFRNKTLVTSLTVSHIILTIIAFLSLVFLGLTSQKILPHGFTFNVSISILLILVFSQFIFIINLLFSLRNKNR